MARPVVFRPAGLDSDSDDEGYLFGDGEDYSQNGGDRGGSQYSDTVPPEPASTGRPPLPVGGFGIPKNFKPKYTGGGPDGAAVGSETSPQTNQQTKKKFIHTKKVKEGDRDVQLEDFRSAVIHGNISQLERFIQQGVSVNEVLRSGWTPLLYAANSANTPAVSFLLQHGANANAKFERDHYTVLMAVCASTCRDEESVLSCVKLLLEKGAAVNDPDRYNMTPLLYAARENKPAVIRLLIEKGANIDKQDNRGYTALIWAVCRGNLQAVKALLEADVDVNKITMEGFTAYDQALMSEREHIAKILKTYSSGKDIEAAMPELTSMVEKERNAPTDVPLGAKINATHYGELELLLMGIELEDLIPKFQDNRVSFDEFLRYRDDDFIKMGIVKSDMRKKMLDTIEEIHKKDWQPTSLPSILYTKYLTCPESTGIIANLREHAVLMSSSAGYISDQIKLHPDMLHKAKSKESVQNLCKITDEAIAKVKVLCAELESLKTNVAKEIALGDFQAADIVQTPTTYTGRRRRPFTRPLLLVCSVSIMGAALWKKDFLWTSIKELMSSRTSM